MGTSPVVIWAIRSGRPRSGGVLARNFIDHRSRYSPPLQRTPLVGMVKGTQEGAIAFVRPFRSIARLSGEQTQAMLVGEADYDPIEEAKGPKAIFRVVKSTGGVF